MSFSNGFRKRMSRYGSSESDSIKNSTFEFVNSVFSNAPNYRVVLVNGVEMDVRVLEGKMANERRLLLRPEQKIDIGSYIDYDSKKWINFDISGDLFSPKATIQMCNETMKWKDIDGNIHEYHVCISATRNTKFDITSDRMQIELLQGAIYVYAPYIEDVKTIRSAQRFIFGNNAYEVSGLDDLTLVDSNKNGIIQFTCRIVTFHEDDDIENKIADNSQLYISESGEEGGIDVW